VAPRRESRERALGLCYELEARDITAEELLADLPVEPDEYAVELLHGVEAHASEIDELLREYSEHWAVERMPAVDRAVLRLGCFELAHEPEVPTAVVISEAVDLAKQYSTKDSGRFVNGLLAKIAEQVRTPSPST
jgi:N utilization substance protein B